MASLIPGYEFDIFISYRQKDNKYDGWVTEFVDNLRKELEATFKEEVSVYFDINPHDGLLETHDVDASLKEKLKCLVFIPIISRTYCDPKSFAWEHEFKAFKEVALNDQFGLKVKLANGNITTRILPVQIHDLNPEDKTLFEKETGGWLRAIEFIYKEPGVNRPFKPDDDNRLNPDKSKYRNQINKTANSIDEIINSLRNIPPKAQAEKPLQGEKNKTVQQRDKAWINQKRSGLTIGKLLAGTVSMAALVVAVVIVYPNVSGSDKYKNIIDPDGRISVAVMPFRNMTGDTLYNKWQDSFQSLIISNLSNTENLSVRSFEAMLDIIGSTGHANYASITPSVARDIALKLESGTIVTGSMAKAGKNLRINLQLEKSESSEIFKAFTLDCKEENEFFTVADSLSTLLNNFLRIEIMKQQVKPYLFTRKINTSSPEAFTYYIEGTKMFIGNNSNAREYFLTALQIDTNFIECYLYLSIIYNSEGEKTKAEAAFQKIYKEKDRFSFAYQQFMESWKYGYLEKNPLKAIQIIYQLAEKEPYNRWYINQIGDLSRLMKNYDKEIEAYEKYIAIDKKWGVVGNWFWPYVELGDAYHIRGDHKREEELFRQALQIRPDNPFVIYRQAKCALFNGDTLKAGDFIRKYLSTQNFNDGQLKNFYGGLYSAAGIPEKAELYYRLALDVNPKNPFFLNNLALLLIRKDIDINEGIGLVNRALELSPDNYTFQYTKGLGLFKLGNYAEALGLLERSWTERINYDQDHYMIIQEAKKAVADQKLNN